MQKLNWLYPKFLTRIDHYLKINSPHIWRTRVHDFGWFSLILGNAVAALLGILIVGNNNVLSNQNVATMHSGLAVMLGFVGLFWAMRLLRFKMKFSNFKTMLTTWVIYVLCVASLGLNLATFTSTIAYRTAYLYPDKTVQADYDYLNYDIVTNGKNIYYYDGENYHLGEFSNKESYIHSDKFIYWDGYLMSEYHTEELEALMSRHGYQYGTDDKIYKSDIDTVKDRLNILNQAKMFVWQPFLGKNYNNYEKRSFYHELLQMNWGMGMFMLFFLPTLLFLMSAFGLRNVLISAFSTALVAGLTVILMEVFTDYYQEEQLLTVYVFIAFVLAMTLAIGKHQLQSWNYIAGVFMLMLGGLFFGAFIVIVENSGYAEENILPVIATLFPISLFVSLITAWVVAKRNDLPVLR